MRTDSPQTRKASSRVSQASSPRNPRAPAGQGRLDRLIEQLDREGDPQQELALFPIVGAERGAAFRYLAGAIPDEESEAAEFYEYARHIVFLRNIAERARVRDWEALLQEHRTFVQAQVTDEANLGIPVRPLADTCPWLANPQWEAVCKCSGFPNRDWFSLSARSRREIRDVCPTRRFGSKGISLPSGSDLSQAGDLHRLSRLGDSQPALLMKGKCLARLVLDINLGKPTAQLLREFEALIDGKELRSAREGALEAMDRLNPVPKKRTPAQLSGQSLRDLAAWRLRSSGEGHEGAERLWQDPLLRNSFQVAGSDELYSTQASFIRAANQAQARLRDFLPAAP